MFHQQLKLLVCAVIATIAMGAAVSTASASTGLSVTNGVTLASANGSLTVNYSSSQYLCRITLGFDLHSSVAKSVGSSIRTVLPSPASSFPSCGFAQTGVVLGGALEYTGFTGTLPNITSLTARIRDFSFLWNMSLIGNCLYTGTISLILNRNAATGSIDSINASASGTLTPDGMLCPRPVSLQGTLAVLATKPAYGLF